jgi:hypothetical protein
MLNKGSGHTVHGLSFLTSWTALQLGFPIIPLQSFVVVFVLFVVVIVVVRNATHRLPCGIDSISRCNVLCLFPVLSHFEWELWREQSSMSSEVRFTMLIQFIVCWTILYTVHMVSCLYSTVQLITILAEIRSVGLTCERISMILIQELQESQPFYLL